MKTFYSLLLIICASLFLAGCGSDDDPAPGSFNNDAGGGNAGGDTDGDTDDDAGGDETTTTFSLAVEVPEGVTVAMNDPFNPLGELMNSAVAEDVAVEDLDLDNFEVRLFDPDGDGLDGEDDYEVIDSSELVLTDLGDGNYELSVPGEPRLDCVIVTLLTVGGSGNTLELQVPTVRDPAVNSEPLRLNYASTAATRQYVQQAVTSGGFNANLSVDEVDALIEEVSRQVASVPIPEGTDLSDPEAVFNVLDRSARDLVEAQIEIATAPEPEEGSLAARQGNYHGALFGRSVFAQDQGYFMEREFWYEDYTIVNPDEHQEAPTLGGIALTVDEAAKTAEVTFGSGIESYFGVQYGDVPLTVQETFADIESIGGEDDSVPAKILSDGALIINPGTGKVDGFPYCSADDCGQPLYYVEVNNTLNFRLKPWGEAYVASQFFRFDEYALNRDNDMDGVFDTSCINALGLTESDFEGGLSEQAFEDLISTAMDSLTNPAAIVAAECQHNGTMHEVLGLAMAKESSDHGPADLEGQWGVVGIEADHSFSRGSFSSVLTIDGSGNMDESDYASFYAYREVSSPGNAALTFEVESDPVTGAMASVTPEGIVTFNWGEDPEYPEDGAEIDTGFISSDNGLIYSGFRSSGGGGTQDFYGETGYSFAVPLGEGVTAADLAGKTFSFVGIQYSTEGIISSGQGRISVNHDSNLGFKVSFAMNGEALEATLSGSTDLGILDLNFNNGLSSYDSSIELDESVEGVLTIDTIADNGAFTSRYDGNVEDDGDEDLLVKGFYDANGRIIMTTISGDAGVLSATLDQVSEEFPYSAVGGNEFANFGYLLGTCIAGCSAE